MDALRDYSAKELSGMADADLDRARQEVLDARRLVRADKAPDAVPRLLAQTEDLLKRLKDEYERRQRPF